uniref:Trimethylguanosine synthase n=1 Tax=viral metagenome TaxID=1070528 RepID=A0A6C0AJ00_9ZZZZ
MEDAFPKKEGINYNQLQLTEEGEYSITRRRDGEHILYVVSSVVGQLETKSLTDATACVGGDTINFALNFREVHSIEYSKTNFEALKNNVNVFGLTNVSLYLGNCIEIYKWASDVLYVDPPWGGPEYKKQNSIDLYLGATRLDDWLEDILSGPYRPSFVFLKVPINYNAVPLQFLANVRSVRSFRIRSYVLVCITVN